ncbi:hypothetical protein NPIL_402571 [Nephila pilipes]|uniref:Uncharacterized protein n=1 Tax=Nephila pilipes TaxID=299642 RepID=A0A8X6TAB5_NEPPI|nr:hypothetical protein NPIL_402571 [Nephila pilipes]
MRSLGNKFQPSLIRSHRHLNPFQFVTEINSMGKKDKKRSNVLGHLCKLLPSYVDAFSNSPSTKSNIRGNKEARSLDICVKHPFPSQNILMRQYPASDHHRSFHRKTPLKHAGKTMPLP